MEMEERFVRFAQLLEALHARLEVSDSVLAALIATHPDPGAVLREWQPVVAEASTAQALADLSGEDLPNEYRKAAMADQIAHWTDILRGIETHGPASS